APAADGLERRLHDGVGNGPGNDFQDFDAGAVRLGEAEDLDGGGTEAGFLRVGAALLDLGGVAAALEALLELRGVEAEAGGIGEEGGTLERVLVSKEEVVHLPVAALQCL